MFGVSPAFFFSLYSTDFSVNQYNEGLKILKQEGFKGYQLEVFHPEKLDEWINGFKQLKKTAEDLELTETQFVAHFLMPTFSTPTFLQNDSGFDEMKKIAEIVSNFPACTTITIPMAPFDSGNTIISNDEYKQYWESLLHKLTEYSKIVGQVKCNLALEIVPGCLVSNTDGLLRAIEESGIENLGLNFDTGHSWACKEPILTIPGKMKGKIFGTHFKDNFTYENLALPPGEGSINWNILIKSLIESGYNGSLDLEIVSTKADAVVDLYRKGLQTISKASEYTKRGKK
jgi:sugar phosphate isomerase/epimerase